MWSLTIDKLKVDNIAKKKKFIFIFLNFLTFFNINYY